MIGDAEQNHTAGYVRWWSEQGRSIEAIFKPGTLLAQIDREAIRAFIRLRGETVSPATLRHHRSALHRIFRVAISEGLHPGPNPVTSVQWPTVRKRPPRVIRWPILQGCIERVRYEQDSQNDVDLFEFVAMTGLRLSEIARVDIENIDLDAKSILIKGKRRDENVAIPSGTIAAVRRRVKKIESGPLFPGGINWVERRFKVWAKILKQPNWSCHVVGRHSLATHLARKGLPLQTIQRVMRHRSITTTQIYVHLANEDARSAVDGLDLSV